MKRLQPTTKYKKDLKRYANNPKKIAALTEVTSLLIWIDPDTDIIELVRLGTHSELFNK